NAAVPLQRRHDFLNLLHLFGDMLTEEWTSMTVLNFTLSHDTDRMRTCDFCHADIWNRWFHCNQCVPDMESIDASGPTTSSASNMYGHDICVHCFAMGRSCLEPTHMIPYQYQSMEQLLHLYQYAHTVYNNVIRACGLH